MARNELFLGIQGLGIVKSLATCTQETQISHLSTLSNSICLKLNRSKNSDRYILTVPLDLQVSTVQLTHRSRGLCRVQDGKPQCTPGQQINIWKWTVKMEYIISTVWLGCIWVIWTVSLLGFQKNHFPSHQIHYLSASSALLKGFNFFPMLQANPLLKLSNGSKLKPFCKHTSLTGPQMQKLW